MMPDGETGTGRGKLHSIYTFTEDGVFYSFSVFQYRILY